MGLSLRIMNTILYRWACIDPWSGWVAERVSGIQLYRNGFSFPLNHACFVSEIRNWFTFFFFIFLTSLKFLSADIKVKGILQSVMRTCAILVNNFRNFCELLELSLTEKFLARPISRIFFLLEEFFFSPPTTCLICNKIKQTVFFLPDAIDS